MVGSFIMAVLLPAGTIGAFAAVLIAISAFAADRHLLLFDAIATPQVRVTVLALLLRIVVARALAPLIARLAIAAPVRVAVPAALPLVIAEVQAHLIIRLAIASAPVGVTVPAVLFPLVVTEVLAPLIIRLAVATAPVGVTVPAVPLPIVVGDALAPGIVRVAIAIGGRRKLAIFFINRLDHAVEPFADGRAGSACGGARSLARFRTETSEIPRTARFHSRVQATS